MEAGPFAHRVTSTFLLETSSTFTVGAVNLNKRIQRITKGQRATYFDLEHVGGRVDLSWSFSLSFSKVQKRLDFRDDQVQARLRGVHIQPRRRGVSEYITSDFSIFSVFFWYGFNMFQHIKQELIAHGWNLRWNLTSMNWLYVIVWCFGGKSLFLMAKSTINDDLLASMLSTTWRDLSRCIQMCFDSLAHRQLLRWVNTSCRQQVLSLTAKAGGPRGNRFSP